MNTFPGAPAVVDDASEVYDLDWPFTPREGWLSVIALAVMLIAVGVAIDDAQWAGLSVGTRASQTGFLPGAALASVLLGAYLAKTTLSTRRINLIGIFAGAAALLFFVSQAVSRAPTLDARLHDLNLSVSVFFHDVFVLGTRSTESSIFLLILGALVWGAGFYFESVGDWQLARFKSDPANKGKVMRTGLWRYTRHPNYFGDATVWWGLFIIAAATVSGTWTIFSPIVMTFLLLRVSGVALLERKQAETKPEYREYIESTSAFLPWFPRVRR